MEDIIRIAGKHDTVAEKDFAGLRVKLADEANKRLASRKRKDSALAGLYDELILAMLSVFDAYDKSRPFYERGTRVDYETLVSVVTDRIGMDVPDPDYFTPPGALELWSELIHTPLEERAKCPPTAEQHAALICVTHALEDLLYEITGESERRRYDYISEEWWTEGADAGFHWQFWDLLFLTTAVNIREIDNFFKYPEIWQDDITSNELTSISFFFDGSLAEYQKIWESVKAKFRACNPTYLLGTCDHFLPLEAVDYPLAFCFGDPEQALHRLGHAVARALVIYQDLKFDYDNETVMWNPGMTVTRAACQIRWKVVDHIRRARSKCKVPSPAHRKWLEAEAELIAHCGVESDPITHEVADRIVALANDAAHETWIEARSGTRTGAKDAAMDKALQRVASVRLAEDQFARLTSTFSNGSDALKAHVTSETDREIAAKAPKRKQKFGHEGNGHKGPKTKTMEKQRKLFFEFLKKHPEEPGVTGKSRISLAHQCWQQHPEWNKAAKATGEAKGYSNHKSLAQAQ